VVVSSTPDRDIDGAHVTHRIEVIASKDQAARVDGGVLQDKMIA